MIDLARLTKVLSYNRNTGVFRWVSPSCTRIKAGDTAGTVRGRYRVISVDRKIYQAHRLAWFYVHGEWPVGEIDHINGDGFDNRIANLRCVTHSENMKNSPLRADNSTGAPGVYRTKHGRWYAQSCHGGKNKHLGFYSSFEEAKQARLAFQNRHGFHPNHGRTG